VSFVNAMEGAAEREAKAYDQMISLAWHNAMFSRQDRLRKLSHYQTKKAGEAPTWAKAHAFFSGLRSKGIDVKIERVVH
jgi:hypothetical protein